MLEIQPVLPSLPTVRPKKIKRDDNSQNRRQQPGKRQSEQQSAKPIQHIDEIV